MKIAIHGYGRMGRTVERVAAESGHSVVALLRRGSSPELHGADAIVDFSHADAIGHALDLACQRRVPLVIGTTGWQDRLGEVQRRVGQSGVACVYASNFSPGANAVFVLARQAGTLFSRFPQYAAGMEERHHARKKDAPSGTALRIAGEVREGSGGRLDPPIASSRVGSEFGLHTLFFDSADDLVEITHRARGRDGFARGALLAAELIQGRQGLFRFDELLADLREVHS